MCKLVSYFKNILKFYCAPNFIALDIIHPTSSSEPNHVTGRVLDILCVYLFIYLLHLLLV